jgi:hypothetical protein
MPQIVASQLSKRVKQQNVPKLELGAFSKKLLDKNVYEDPVETKTTPLMATPMATTQRRESTSTDKKQMTQTLDSGSQSKKNSQAQVPSIDIYSKKSKKSLYRSINKKVDSLDLQITPREK